MSGLAALFVAFFLLSAVASAQHPLRHFTDAVEMRYARSHPVISYRLRVDPKDLSGFAVEMRIRNAPDTVRLAMAAHPEYDDRYFRYVEGFAVECQGSPVPFVREDSAVWRIPTRGGDATVRYRIALPAPQEAPRAAWKPFLSPTGGLVGGTHSFMYILGATLAPSHVTLDLPAAWNVATGLEPTFDPHTFFAPTVDALVDSPVMVGQFRSWRFAVDDVPHRIVYWPAPNAMPFDTLAFITGVEQIARQAVALFGRVPYRDYTFIYQDNAYGGLEHRNSVTLGAPSAELAHGLGGVFAETAHEYTHTWNLMRIRPEEYGDVSHRTQKPVAGLWFSEGMTIKYGDLFLRRAGLPVQDSTRIEHLQQIISRYLSNPGNSRFSAEQISRVAYNSQPGALGDYNASVHLVGEVIGNVLDFTIRDATSGRRSMDDVMRLMLDRFSAERGFSGRDVRRVVEDVCGCSVKAFFDAHVSGASPIDFDAVLRLAGLKASMSWEPVVERDGRRTVDLRVRAYEAPDGGLLELIVANPTSAWGRAGLHTHDRLVSINGKAITAWPEMRAMLGAAKIGDTVRFEVTRPSGPFRTNVVVSGFDRPMVRITELPNGTERQRMVRAGWLAKGARE